MNPWPWLESLARASLEGGLLILGVWATCRLWPALPAWARSAMWWLACARLLIALLPLMTLSVPVPAVPTATWWPAAVAAPLPATPLVGARPAPDPATSKVPFEGKPPRSGGMAFDPSTIALALLGLWAMGTALRTAGLARQYRKVQRARRAATPGPRDLFGLPDREPRVAVSAEAPAPMVTGLLRPLVLIPAAMLERRPEELRLALAHELAHVRRGDLWLAWVPAVAEILFWFHPLVRLCVREYVQACEEACDREALAATGASPYEYGRLLLALGVHRRLAGATAMPCGSPHPRQLTRRLSMLEHLSPLAPRGRRMALALLCAFALVGLAPLRIVPASDAASRPPQGGPGPAAATTADRSGSAQARGAPVAPAPPAPPVPAPGEGPEDSEPPEPPPGPEGDPDPDRDQDWDWEDQDVGRDVEKEWRDAERAKRAARTPRAVQATRARRSARAPRAQVRGSGYGYCYVSDDQGERFAYALTDDGRSFTLHTGDAEDWRDVERLKRELDRFLWVRIGHDRYVVEDPELLRRAHEAFEPQRELGERQSRLGSLQARIGDAQAQVGERQAEIGDQQSDLGARQTELSQRLSERMRRGRSVRDLEREMEELSNQMEQLSRRQEEISRQMEPLGRQQEELGAQQEALAREMEKASRQAQRGIRALIEEAIQSGAARRLR